MVNLVYHDKCKRVHEKKTIRLLYDTSERSVETSGQGWVET